MNGCDSNLLQDTNRVALDYVPCSTGTMQPRSGSSTQTTLSPKPRWSEVKDVDEVYEAVLEAWATLQAAPLEITTGLPKDQL